MAGRVDLAGKAIGIVGLGQIGGSMAAALEARTEAVVYGFDTNAELVNCARERRIISEVFPCEELIAHSEIVVLATPQEVTLELLRDHIEALRAKRLVIDTCSLKVAVCELAAQLDLTNFVGCHPLAGSEKRGAEAWDPILFTDCAFLHWPGEEFEAATMETMYNLIAGFGGRLEVIMPDEHDHLFALTSGLPHALALTLRALLNAESGKNPTKLAGPSFQSATRMAGSDPALLRHLVYDNRENVANQLDKLIARLTQLRDDLRSDSTNTLDELLKD